MDKTLAAAAMFVVILLPLQTRALPNPDTGPGCGLGKTLWSNSMNQKNILPQTFMATTNVTGFQTFAISTGTSGCSNDGVLWADTKTELFIAANYDDLSQEMAQAGGEHLFAFASMLGVREHDYAEFFAFTQQHHGTLIRTGPRSSHYLLASLLTELSQHRSLAYVTAGR